MNVDQDNKLGKFCDNSESKSQWINMFASNTLTPKGKKIECFNLFLFPCLCTCELWGSCFISIMNQKFFGPLQQ